LLAPLVHIGHGHHRGHPVPQFITYRQVMSLLAGQDQVYDEMRRDFFPGVHP
jgi:hypothetical protein